jgi:hypothetical protein
LSNRHNGLACAIKFIQRSLSCGIYITVLQGPYGVLWSSIIELGDPQTEGISSHSTHTPFISIANGAKPRTAQPFVVKILGFHQPATWCLCLMTGCGRSQSTWQWRCCHALLFMTSTEQIDLTTSIYQVVKFPLFMHVQFLMHSGPQDALCR